MGLKLSTLYFEPQTGRPNLRFLTLKTALILGLYLNAYFFTVGTVRDNSMSPFLWKAGATHFSDLVLYGKVLSPTDRLKDRIVALKNPFEPKEVVFRRVIAEEGDWVQRADDGGIIKVPKGHVWVECENGKERRVDSLSEDLGGPVSKKFVQG
jgi:inner membrane protease subunit 2